MAYDAVLVVSFGGPEKPEDVLPFLENVTRGRNIPGERLLAVAEHYHHFGGKSPINDQNRALIAALREYVKLPIYWGNRNWHPFLAETLRQMRDDGVKEALAFVTSAYSSYSGCRQYRENMAAAQAEVGEDAPKIDKLRGFFNHPGFIEACADRVREARKAFSPVEPVRLVATAHSIPSSMAETSAYEAQLLETARLVFGETNCPEWDLVYQSRSGPPTQPWLGPDVLDHLRDLHGRGVRNVILAPIGFISDHLEVRYDLDTEAMDLAKELGMKVVRAGTAGTHPAFVRAIAQLIEGPSLAACPVDCCPPPQPAGRPPVSVTQIASLRP